MIIFNSNVLKFGGFWLGFGSSPTPPTPTIYRINVPPTVEHGTVSVNPTEGPTGTLVTISTVPDTGYELDTISLTGAELINGNQFYIDGSDVTVNVTFTAINYNPLNLPPYTVRVRTDGHPPHRESQTSYETATLVPGTSDIYDVYKSGTSFENLLNDSFNVLEVLGANTTGITNMKGMLYYCSRLTSVALFDTSSVTDMGWMFYNCSSLTTVPLFDTSNVTYTAAMFQYCSALTSVPLFNTSNVTSMARMFECCNALTSVPLFNTSNVTNMTLMFDGCITLTSVPLFDTSSVTDMVAMFANCYALTTVPLFDTSSVTNMRSMLESCYALTTVPLFDTSNVTSMELMFMDCYAVESGALALYQQASSQANPPNLHGSAFSRCGRDTVTGAAELAQIPKSWGGTKA